MNTRNLSILAFVALCLLLSGWVLRRQIAAHPLPRDGGESQEQIVTGTGRQAVISSIRGQLEAFRANDSQKAMFYQSRRLRRNFQSAQSFTDMIRAHYPEFGHCRAAQFGPVRLDPARHQADVIVTVQGENGQSARGDYHMIYERGLYRVAGVEGGGRLSR